MNLSRSAHGTISSFSGFFFLVGSELVKYLFTVFKHSHKVQVMMFTYSGDRILVIGLFNVSY